MKRLLTVLVAAALLLYGCDDEGSSGGTGDGTNSGTGINDGTDTNDGTGTNSGTNDGTGTNSGTNDGTGTNSGTNDGTGGSGVCDEAMDMMFDANITPTNYVYVSNDGDDDAGDGSYDNPYATLRRALRDAEPGTSIILMGGFYEPAVYEGGIYIEDLHGTPTAPIWIGGDTQTGGGIPKIDGAGHSEVIHLSKVSYLVLHDMEIYGSEDNGINCDDGGEMDNDEATHHVIFRNLYIHDVGGDGNQDCLKLSGVNHFVVYGSEITRCGGNSSGSAIDCVGCHHGIIGQNDMHDLSANAVQTKGGSEDIEIWGNLIQNGGARALNMGGSTGYQFFRPPLDENAENFEARNIRAIANVIVGGETAFAFVGCDSCVFANNIVVNPDRWLFRILQETVSDDTYDFAPCRNGVVVNNIFEFEAGQIRTYVNVGPNTEAESFTFSHNVWYASDDPSSSEPTLPASETDGIYGEDPDLLGVEYLPQNNQLLEGAGEWHDFLHGDYYTHCFKNPPSIGAYELGNL